MLLSLNASYTVFWAVNCTNQIPPNVGFACEYGPLDMHNYFWGYMAMNSSTLTNFTTPSIGIDGFSYWGKTVYAKVTFCSVFNDCAY